MKYTIENPRPCIWCEFDFREGVKAISSDESAERYFKTYGPKLVNLGRKLRINLIETVAIQCNNCGLITPSAETPELAWKYC